MYNYCKTIAHSILKVGYCMEYENVSLFQRIFYRKNVECTYSVNNFISYIIKFSTLLFKVWSKDQEHDQLKFARNVDYQNLTHTPVIRT